MEMEQGNEVEFYFNGKYLTKTSKNLDEETLCGIVNSLGVCSNDVYYISNGRPILEISDATSPIVHINVRLRGGKGGFGSMLRAIGAQIEKTTNREACRDLSGRRLRDINEEKRLRTWIDQQADREKDDCDKKQQKLERLCREPKFEFRDEQYEKERSSLPNRVESAVEEGFAAAAEASGSGTKRKKDMDVQKTKKRKMWLDDDLSDLSGSSDSEGGDCNETTSLERKIDN